jgi:hypothetical protein
MTSGAFIWIKSSYHTREKPGNPLASEHAQKPAETPENASLS